MPGKGKAGRGGETEVEGEGEEKGPGKDREWRERRGCQEATRKNREANKGRCEKGARKVHSERSGT